MKEIIKNFLVLILFFLFLSFLFGSFSLKPPERISLTKLVQDINEEKIKKIVVVGNNLQVFYDANKMVLSQKESQNPLSQTLLNLGVKTEKLSKVEIEEKEEKNILGTLGFIFSVFLPLIVSAFFILLILRQSKAGAMQVFDFTQAKARVFGVGGKSKERITFKDVAGLKEAKQELMEVVDFLKNPKKFLAMGAKIPKGVLLMGPSGCGKTLLARAVAGESNVPFLSISGSEFVELFVGTGAARVRSLFQQAKKLGRCIIFIDELDAVGRRRGLGFTGGHEEREQTLNQILVEMDGFEKEAEIIVLAATNRADVLDPALLRPGRFDRKISVDLPDVNDREEILKIHARGKPLSIDVNLREVAERTPGFSGADLANVVNEAAILAARKNKSQISQEDLLESIEKVLLGPERKSHLLSKKEKEIAAYHESGHALVSAFLPDSEPIRKVSIIARGMAAGYTLRMPTEEKKMRTKKEFLAEIATLLGGYVAEKIKFNEITTGAANDLQKASQLARKLVTEYGMSSLGPIAFREDEEILFFEPYSGAKLYSEKTAAKIDKEIEKIIKECENKAQNILKNKKSLLEKVAKTLMEKETIEKEEFEKLIKRT
jgi:cell division protease FtsH